jgi:glycosyltransferase involved in cell wall biosynthesis
MELIGRYITSLNKNMKILYIFGGEKAQGAEIVIERLINNNTGQVDAHLLLAPGRYASQLMNSNRRYRTHTSNYLKKLNRSSNKAIKYLALALRNYFVVPFEVNKYIRKYKIEMVHVNTIVPASYLTLLILYTRIFKPSIKWIWSDHDLRYFSKMEMLLAKICVWCYDQTLVVSNAVKQKYSNQEKVTVIYNGLDTSKFKNCDVLRNIFRSRYLIPPETMVVGIAGVIHESKGQLGLVHVIKQIFAKHTNVSLVIAGDFSSETPAYAAQLGREIADEEDIKYVGYANGMDEFYNGCDIIVNNSNNYRSEALGTTIYEAMACEKIVIAARTGGTPEIITDQVDGLLFTPEDEDDLFSKLEYAVTHFNELIDIRKNARRKVLQCFNIEIMTKKYNELLQAQTPDLAKQETNWKVS